MSFKRLNNDDFVISSDAVQSTAWSTGQPSLSEFYTSSVQAAGSSGNYYLSIYQTSSTLESSAVQFDIAYADVDGFGSEYYDPGLTAYTPSSTTYGQYRTMILEDENSNFFFGTDTNTLTGSNFWVLSVERSRYKEKLFPETFNLTLSGSGIGYLHLTNTSADSKVQTFLGSSKVYQVVSGSNGSAIAGGGYVANSGSYGLFFPTLGTVLLNPHAISQSIHIEATRSADLPNGTNQATLYTSISGGAAFTLNSQETISSDYIFIRAKNSEFNYSENPSFISGSTGEVIYSSFINSPQTYITTVGMYNDANELLAVAKLSRPLLKDFTKESLVRVKLDF